jgi:ACS family glucarate transporter-like MFS transporter
MITPSSPPPPSFLDRPTHVRHRVVGLVIVLGMITYIDRACISRMTEPIMRDLSLDKVQMSWVFSAFAIAYAIFEIPTGCMADRSGTRRVFARIVLWWSVFTMATAAAFNYVSMLVVRFLFGAGEAGAWPCMARTFSRWIPLHERGVVQGIFFAGAHLGAALTPFLVTHLLGFMSWRMVFVCFGLLGVGWTVIWYYWFRDEPADHPAVNAAERALIEGGRGPSPHHEFNAAYWKKLFSHRNVLALCLMYFPNSMVFYFCITWLPTYLKEKHHFTGGAADFYAGLPFFVAIFGDLCGGFITDGAVKRFGPRWGRTGVGAATCVVAALALLAVPLVPNPHAAAILIAFAVAATMTSLAATWATCIEVGGSQPGVVGATMNSAGQVGAMLCPLVVGYSLEWFQNWDVTLYVIGGLFIVATACWMVIDPREKVFPA